MTHNPTPGHIPREDFNTKRYMHPNIHCSTLYNLHDTEAASMSTDKEMDKEDLVCIYKGICVCAFLLRLSVLPDSVTPWTIAHQSPLSMAFSRQEY